MNSEMRTKSKNDFEKDFFKPTNNSIFRKTMENVKRHRDIKNMTTDRRRSNLASTPSYDTAKCFPEKLSEIQMNKTNKKEQASVIRSVNSIHQEDCHV